MDLRPFAGVADRLSLMEHKSFLGRSLIDSRTWCRGANVYNLLVNGDLSFISNTIRSQLQIDNLQ